MGQQQGLEGKGPQECEGRWDQTSGWSCASLLEVDGGEGEEGGGMWVLVEVPVSLTPPGPTSPRLACGARNAQQCQSIQIPSGPQFPLLWSESKELTTLVSSLCKVARRCPHPKTPPGDCPWAARESELPPPLPLPLHGTAAGPPPPPRLRCAMGGGRRAERRGSEPPPDPIQARRGERTGTRRSGPPAPSDPHWISGQGLGDSGDHPPPGSEAEPAA